MVIKEIFDPLADEELQDIKTKYLAAISDADANKTKMTDNELIKKGLEDAIDKLK